MPVCVALRPLASPLSRAYGLSREEEDYLNRLRPGPRQRLLDTLEQHAAAKATDAVPLKFQVLRSQLPNKAHILSRLRACESPKFEGWVQNALALPLGRYVPPPMRAPTAVEFTAFLQRARGVMDREITGHVDAKEAVLRTIGQWVLGGELNTFAIGLQGAAGIGKTTFAQNALSAAMGRPFCFISLGGCSDAAHLVGHSQTYEGAVCGRIADAVRACGVMNPVLYFDELCKVSKSHRGDEIINVLIHLTDREQNAHFRDRYFQGIDLDLSQALLVFSVNDAEQVNPVLLDRLQVIRLGAPSRAEKLDIARRHLLPRALRAVGLEEGEVVFGDDSLAAVVAACDGEAGVRELDRTLTHVVSTIGIAGRVEKRGILRDADAADVRLPCHVDAGLAARLMRSVTATERGACRAPAMMYT